MRVKDSLSQSSFPGLVPKNHFCSLSLFRREPLINWSYTDSVLFTAFDYYRSTDFWIDSVVRSGMTFKQALMELGFPQTTSIMVDTGIFEVEARKANMAKELGIQVDISLSNDEIFAVYELSGGDLFVSPDEIVLATDNETEIAEKIKTIKQNLVELLEIVPAKKIVAVIQGHDKITIDQLFGYYRDHGIEYFALGGIIPLYRYDKELFKKVINYVRKVTEGFHLHTFGLPRVSLLKYYLQYVGVDSVDTSMLLYLTAKRRYLFGSIVKQVRYADFSSCTCPGCRDLSEGHHPRSVRFFIALYIHNIIEAAKVAEGAESTTKERQLKRTNRSMFRTREKKSQTRPLLKEHTKCRGWMTAKDLMLRKPSKE